MSINWDKIAELYAEQRPRSYLAIIEEPIVSKMLCNVRGKKVLDAGCAGGYFSTKLYDNGAEVFGIDISKRMLDYAKRANKDKNINFIRADVNHLPFPDRSFDIVLASMLFNNIWDYETSVKSIHKTLKKNGDFIFSVEHPVLTSGDYEGIHPIVYDYFTQRYVERDWTFGGERVKWKTIHRPISYYLNPLTKRFKILGISEPKPPKKLKEINNEIYKKRMIAPVLFIVHSKKITKI